MCGDRSKVCEMKKNNLITKFIQGIHKNGKKKNVKIDNKLELTKIKSQKIDSLTSKQLCP